MQLQIMITHRNDAKREVSRQEKSTRAVYCFQFEMRRKFFSISQMENLHSIVEFDVCKCDLFHV